MEIGVQFQRLCHVQIQRMLLIIGTMVAFVILFQFLAFPYKNHMSTLSHASKGSVFAKVKSATLLSGSKIANQDLVHGLVNNSMPSDSEDMAGDETEMEGTEKGFDFLSDDDDDDDEMDNVSEMEQNGQSHNESTSDSNFDLDKNLRMRNVIQTDNGSTQEMVTEFQLGRIGHVMESNENSTFPTHREIHNQSVFESPGLVSARISTNEIEDSDTDSRTPLSSVAGKISPAHNDPHLIESQPKHLNNELLRRGSAFWSNNSLVAGNSILSRRRVKATTISLMNLLLRQGSDSSKSLGPRWSSPRDRELQFARLQIENAPIIRSSLELYASLFRNFSTFKRSYELMGSKLKVYIYREGEKPIFHQPKLRGIYSSEGWFMKLMEGNKQFVVKDPRKAHLFYLPFSSQRLRIALHQETFGTQRDFVKYLKNYTDVIAKKYRFWNRVRGADHFLVACHDWAPRMTRKSMGNCIRALCNANVARDFRIGKDVSLPVTNIRTSQEPDKDLGGKPPSERHILAFFAGSMHGYLRPILLHYWENKEPDLKIFGPLPRDIEGKTKYREYMKSSKYCICARGYEVHTPRVVEAIYNECVPVIISDNYVPPFFEILDWEAFSVFVLEKDVPNLRNVLLSIPEERYLAMQQRVKMVQKHFLWHKKPVKYDLFHMILHSIWYNRVFQVRLWPRG